MKNLGFDRKGLINKCPRCKAKISPGYRFCSSCGYRFIKTEQSSSTKRENKEEKIVRTYHDHTSSIPSISKLIKKTETPNSTKIFPQIKVREFQPAPMNEKKEKLKVISYDHPVNLINSEAKQNLLSVTNSLKRRSKIQETSLSQSSLDRLDSQSFLKVNRFFCNTCKKFSKKNRGYCENCGSTYNLRRSKKKHLIYVKRKVEHKQGGIIDKPLKKYLYIDNGKRKVVNLRWVELQYYTLGKSIQDIADELGLSMISVRKWFNKYSDVSNQNLSNNLPQLKTNEEQPKRPITGTSETSIYPQKIQISGSSWTERIHDLPREDQSFSTKNEKIQEHATVLNNHLKPDHMGLPSENISPKPIIDSVQSKEIVPISIPAIPKEKKKEVKPKPTYYFCSFCGIKSRKKPKFCIQCGTILKKSIENIST